jgi:leucyl-tRNA synthetase
MIEKSTSDNESNRYDFEPVEKRWSLEWEKNQIYKSEADASKEKFYCLDTWPYPSAEGVHIGYVKSYCGMDVVARYKRMKGFNVLYPMGWDTFGLPAENFALKSGRHPKEITDESIQMFKRQFNTFGLSYDWNRELNTADPEYYKWTQWMFLLMFKNGLAYRKMANVNWCPNDKTVISNEQVVDGKCERCGAEVVKKELMQWFFKVTDYADRLYEDCSKLNWDEKYLNVHKNWIGKEVKDGETTFHVRDWSIARQRYWGPPIPIIYCDKCGTVPVPEDQLPVTLPHDINVTPTGESPLATSNDFVNTICPTCGGKAKREVDILDTFVSSAWYQFRFPDPKNPTEFASKETLNYWGAVDHYEGTIEHLTAHLVYARFVTKVLFDKGYVPVDEPFPKYTPVGLLVDKEGTKFSKRYGNAPDTNSLIKEYGGDLLRLSCFFITPFDDISRWGIQDVVGVEKFRNRIWRVFKEKVDGKSHPVPESVTRQINQLVKNVEDAIDKMSYNVAISKMMVFTSEMASFEGVIDKDVWETFTKLLAPFAPFFAEEMWSQMGNSESIHTEAWPKYDKKQIEKKTISIAIQINGKVKKTMEVDAGISQEEVIGLVKAMEDVWRQVDEDSIIDPRRYRRDQQMAHR